MPSSYFEKAKTKYEEYMARRKDPVVVIIGDTAEEKDSKAFQMYINGDKQLPLNHKYFFNSFELDSKLHPIYIMCDLNINTDVKTKVMEYLVSTHGTLGKAFEFCMFL